MKNARDHTWLLFIHQLPPKPAYLRVKVRRRLHGIGAVAVKNSVYVLPNREDTLEDFQWLLKEIQREGGDGVVCLADFVEGLSNAGIIRTFNRDRDAAYAAIARQARKYLGRTRSRPGDSALKSDLPATLAKLRKNLETVSALDFFGAKGRRTVESVLGEIERRLGTARNWTPADIVQPKLKRQYTGRTWVTRANIFVDRMASAWLIKRFIDTRARFKFVDAQKYRPRKREIWFDTYDGEFTHQGDWCTFEVLCESFGLRDATLVSLAEIVHDIDIKDNKYSREEAPGVALALRGIRAAGHTDRRRLSKSSEFFDALYEELRLGGGRKRRG